jgi:hypothetical protein
MADDSKNEQSADSEETTPAEPISLVDDLPSPLNGVVDYVEALIAFAMSIENELRVEGPG